MKIVVVVPDFFSTTASHIYEGIDAANSLGQDHDSISLWLIEADQESKASIPDDIRADDILRITASGLKTYVPESCLDLLMDQYNKEKPDVIIFDGGFAGKELAVRLAYRTGGSSLTDVVDMRQQEDKLKVIKPVYSSNLKGEFVLHKSPYILSIAKGTYNSKPPGYEGLSHTEDITIDGEYSTPWIKDIERVSASEKDHLENAPAIVVGGRGISNSNNFKLIDKLAAQLKGKAGATRPAVMSGWTAMNSLIGQSGNIVSPDICIVAAASGTSAFTYGIKDSELIIAINSDENAPIFTTAHVGIVDDYKDIINELIDIIDEDMEKE